MNEKQLIKLLKTGNFTVLYHDNGSCGFYKGKFKYDDPKERKPILSCDCQFDGYLPKEVELLIKALGGSCDSV